MPTLQFKGKTFVQNHHLAVPFHQLVPQPDKSLTDKVSLNDNLILQGDNLAALKALLPTYAGRVKCIYIDPPYNTGNEGWVYNDNVKSPLIKEWIGQVVGKEGEDLVRHDKWLCMMMPRLKLLRELLTDDGVISISIDDNELYNLKALMDEVFGEHNFVSLITVQSNPRGRQSEKFFATVHEYLLVYAKDINRCAIDGATLNEESQAEYKHDDGDGNYRLLGLRQRGAASRREDRPNMFFPLFVNPSDGSVSLKQSNSYTEEVFPRKSDGTDGRWMWSKQKVEEGISLGLVQSKLISSRNEYDIFIKDFLEKDGNIRTRKEKTIWDSKEINYQNGRTELKEIFGEPKFDYPKPPYMIKKILSLTTDANDIVVDSFAGSGTTAQAVLELNKEDGGNRKFILVEMEDYSDTITAERVRRVIKGVPTAKNELVKEGLGGSFSYFELGDAIEMESLLAGKTLPSYEELGRYLFYTATGEEFKQDELDESSNYVGKTDQFDAYMFYKPELEYLKTTALTLDTARALREKAGNRPLLVFAPTKYVEQQTLDELNITFCQLPFEIYRLKN